MKTHKNRYTSPSGLYNASKHMSGSGQSSSDGHEIWWFHWPHLKQEVSHFGCHEEMFILGYFLGLFQTILGKGFLYFILYLYFISSVFYQNLDGFMIYFILFYVPT